MSLFNTSAPADWRNRAIRQARLVLIIALVLSTLMVLKWGQPFLPTFVFCLTISICCSALIQSFSAGATWLRNRWRPAGQEAASWPGWPLMLVCLLLGTGLGYSIGDALGSWLTGVKSHGLYSGDWRQAASMLLMSLLPGLVVTQFFVNRGRLQIAQVQAQTAQRLAAENQLRLLESQLEPHMLFNTLATLRVLIALDPARAQAMLDQLIAFLRATLRASRSGSHGLGEEFARLQDYLALMQIRMGERLRPVFELAPELANLPVPPLLLQPLVENAIKHGLEPSVEGGELKISARLSGTEELLLEVQDGGVGLQATPAKPSESFGLHQVRERLATQFGSRASLNVAARPDGGCGTLASIRLPLN